ncbi:MAG: MotA/TolQ/ExbB proton channel family protein [Rhodospirillales bacterium]|nr:MotA/TolQ/ExbB proton channel family protein [Alphaproteobacteria bacterium]MCB9987114.1 MotA/TolQ/ExbB proton channel family protein [Rhodospirillales bacterium]USO08127.1 MAG: MotA/TolQ/ExbB proton channel family protein [Rhodospirillales bacterium]
MAEDTSASTISAPGAVRIARPQRRIDMATAIGMFATVALIGAALFLTGSIGSYLDLHGVLMVICGTVTITAVSYSADDLKKSVEIFRSALIKNHRDPSAMARQLLDLATLVRMKGPLAISQIENELRKDPFLYQGVMFIADGYNADEIHRILTQDIESVIDRHRRTASIARRAAEVAPAMGLIGTLMGLVQMLNNLDDPSKIGPAMAIALLTTFYGAMMSTVLLMPLAAKLERNSGEDVMIKDMVLAAIISMARQDHPRKLEHELNMLLPPGQRVRYFNQ